MPALLRASVLMGGAACLKVRAFLTRMECVLYAGPSCALPSMSFLRNTYTVPSSLGTLPELM